MGRRHLPTVERINLHHPHATVSDLHDAIVQSLCSSSYSSDSSGSGNSSSRTTRLVLYLTKRLVSSSLDGYVRQSSWLQQTHLPLLDQELVRENYMRLVVPERPLSCGDLLGTQLALQDKEDDSDIIHVVAWATTAEEETHGPPRKRRRTELLELTVSSAVTHPPVLLHTYCVPLDTIPAFEATKRALATGNAKPIVLLYGPLFCGKSIVFTGIWRWICKRRGGQCLKVDLKPSFGDGDDVCVVWKALGRAMRSEIDSKAAFVEVVATIVEPWYLLVDNLHLVLETQPVVVSQLLDLLCELRDLTYFGGFVGVGSRELQSLVASDDRLTHSTDLIEVTPFSKPQMAVCFDQMMGEFDASQQQEIMTYSSGSPGVFGSLVEWTASCSLSQLPGHQWLQWFETMGFATYVTRNYLRFAHLVTEWETLTELTWDDLTVALEKNCSVQPRSSSSVDIEAVEKQIQHLRGMEKEHASHETDPTLESCGLEKITRRIRVLYLSIIVQSQRHC